MSYFDSNMNEVYFGGVESDKMLRAYFTNNCDRTTCYECRFKKRYRISDFTLWDCFQPRFFNKEFDDDKGTSSVLVNTIKGKELLQEIIENGYINYMLIEPDELVYGNRELTNSVIKGDIRDSFLNDAKKMSGKQLFEKYFPDSEVLPIIMPSFNYTNAESILPIFNGISGNILVIASVDFAHYQNEKQTLQHDQKSIETLKSMTLNQSDFIN